MGVLKGSLYFWAAVFGLGAIILLWYRPLAWPVWLVPAVVLGGLSYLTFKQAKKFGAQADASMDADFEQTVRELAAKSNGQVALTQLVSHTGLTQAEVQKKMHALMGRGVCEMDFGPNGEELFKLTPLDEARANIAKMSEKV